jgi:hypothetical protein
MQNSQLPLKWYKPFAADDANKVEIPVTSANPLRASQSLGFPPLTMQPPESGGVPPEGEDFNGAMNQVARVVWWMMGGGALPFDAAWAADANIGGYPQGAAVTSADLLGEWLSTADNNTNNPDTVGTAWVPGYSYGSTSLTGLTNANVTLTPAQAAKETIRLAGTLTGNIQIILPTWLKSWTVINNCTGAFSVTCKTAAGSGVVISQGGGSQIVWGDGTNLIALGGNSSSPLLVGPATLGTHATTLAQLGLRGLVSLTTSGNFTVPADVYAIDVQVWAGGGGGGGSGGGGGTAGGGGGAGYARKRIAVTPGQVIAYVVGTGGSAGGAGASGSTGTVSSFGAFCTAQPGVGGTLNPSGNGGAGGTATGGDVNMNGAGAGTGSASNVQGGAGGSAAAGGGGGGGAQGNAAGGAFPGGGGGGGGSAATGGAGANGLIVVAY